MKEDRSTTINPPYDTRAMTVGCQLDVGLAITHDLCVRGCGALRNREKRVTRFFSIGIPFTSSLDYPRGPSEPFPPSMLWTTNHRAAKVSRRVETTCETSPSARKNARYALDRTSGDAYDSIEVYLRYCQSNAAVCRGCWLFFDIAIRFRWF